MVCLGVRLFPVVQELLDADRRALTLAFELVASDEAKWNLDKALQFVASKELHRWLGPRPATGRGPAVAGAGSNGRPATLATEVVKAKQSGKGGGQHGSSGKGSGKAKLPDWPLCYAE